MDTSGCREQARLEDLCILDWIAPDLWAHFTSINNGKEPKRLIVSGSFDETGMRLGEQLERFQPDDLLCVLMHSQVGSDGPAPRIDHRLVIDRASFLQQRYLRFWHGKVNHGEYYLEIGFSYYPKRDAVHFHTVSFGKGDDSSWRGKGLMSRTFRNLVSHIERFYPRKAITAVAVSTVGKHWVRKYFGARRLATRIERTAFEREVYVRDENEGNVFEGHIGSGPKV